MSGYVTDYMIVGKIHFLQIKVWFGVCRAKFVKLNSSKCGTDRSFDSRFSIATSCCIQVTKLREIADFFGAANFVGKERKTANHDVMTTKEPNVESS